MDEMENLTLFSFLTTVVSLSHFFLLIKSCVLLLLFEQMGMQKIYSLLCSQS